MNFILKMVVVNHVLTILNLRMENVYILMCVIKNSGNTRKLMDHVVRYISYVMITTWMVVNARHVLKDMRSTLVANVVKRIITGWTSNVEHSIWLTAPKWSTICAMYA